MAAIHNCLLLGSLDAAAPFPDIRLLIFTNEPMADMLLKLLLLPSLEFQDFLDLLGLEGLVSISVALFMISTVTRLTMLHRQKGQMGASHEGFVGSGFFWQQRARVQ